MATAVAAAIAVPVALALSSPATGFGWPDLLFAGSVVAGSAITIEMGRFFEGGLRIGQRPHKGLSAWAIAAVIVLPLFWVLPVMVGVYAYARWRGLRVPLWKWVGSCAFLVLAALASGWTLRIGHPSESVEFPSDATGVLVVGAAILVFVAVESGLFFGAAHLCDEADELWLRRTLADPGFYLTESAVLALGAVTGLLGVTSPWFVLLLLPVFGLMQQAVLNRPLRDQAGVDAKTGLLQYERWLGLAAGQIRHQMTARPWTVLFADLDHFKQFNDRFGHLAGDRALAVVAQVLRDCLRERDLIARFGGEEFCILLPDTTTAQAAIVAERIRSTVNSATRSQAGGAVTISIGVAGVAADQSSATLDDTLDRADAALYRAKADGRDLVFVAEPAPSPTVVSSAVHAHSQFRHEALLYTGIDGFLAAVLPFVRDGLARDEPVMVAVIARRLEALRTALGADAGRVRLVDMASLGANPARIIPAWREFVDLNLASGRPIRGVGEPIWSGRSPAELIECQLHESLLNLAVAPDTPLWLLCPYDTEALPAAVISEARRSHPVLARTDKRRPSDSYAGTGHARDMFEAALPSPVGPVHEFAVDDRRLAEVPGWVALQAARAGLAADRTDNLVTALTDITRTSVNDARRAMLRSWQEGHTLIHEVRDPRVIDDPMVGRGGSTPRDIALGHAHQLCDLIQVRSGATGTIVRTHSQTTPIRDAR